MRILALITSIVASAAVTITAIPSGAATFESLDEKTAVAGASYALESFLRTTDDANRILNEYLNGISAEDAQDPSVEIKEEPVSVQAPAPAYTVSYYETAKTGIVVSGSILNVREAPSTKSSIVSAIMVGKQVKIVGECKTAGATWYYLSIADYYGFVAGNFIEIIEPAAQSSEETETAVQTVSETEAQTEIELSSAIETQTETEAETPTEAQTETETQPSDESSETESEQPTEDTTSTEPETEATSEDSEPSSEAETTTTQSEETPTGSTETETVSAEDDVSVLPEAYTLSSDTETAGEEVFGTLSYYRDEINYCLSVELPNRMDAGDVTGAYSALVYILEEYQNIAEIAAEYGLQETFASASHDISKIEYARSQLSLQTGKSENEFFEEIRRNNEAARAADEEAERQRLAAEEAARQAEEAARQAEEAQRLAEEQAEAKEAAKRAEEAARQAEKAKAQAEEIARQAEEARKAAEAAIQNGWEEAYAAAKAENAGTLGREIADCAESYIGWLPYVWGGASLSDGADCSGFVSQIMAAYGLLNQGIANYHGYVSGTLREVGYEVPVTEMQPGDIVCYSGHVAIYFGNGIVVHEPAPGRFAEYGSAYMKDIITVRRMY